MSRPCRAYLDIETTGLDARRHEITVVGVCLERGSRARVVQLYGRTLTPERLLATVAPADVLYTYNGARFDLPFIARHLGVDLCGRVAHDDLMYHCWRHRLKGGLKAVERRLGIGREVTDVDGYGAVLLWRKYRDEGCRRSLRKLLRYNAEDVRNLIPLRRMLGVGEG
jgi:uncharacterized protein YprB with RNaseH-like and TPR domain